METHSTHRYVSLFSSTLAIGLHDMCSYCIRHTTCLSDMDKHVAQVLDLSYCLRDTMSSIPLCALLRSGCTTWRTSTCIFPRSKAMITKQPPEDIRPLPCLRGWWFP